MAGASSVDISRLIDERGITRFNIGLVIFAFFVVLVDGYDISALGFANTGIGESVEYYRHAMH